MNPGNVSAPVHAIVTGGGGGGGGGGGDVGGGGVVGVGAELLPPPPQDMQISVSPKKHSVLPTTGMI